VLVRPDLDDPGTLGRVYKGWKLSETDEIKVKKISHRKPWDRRKKK